MDKRIVRFNNDLNSVTFGKFKEKELDLFFSICFKLKELGTNEVEISFEELKELSQYSNRNKINFINDLESTYNKMLELNIKIRHSELSFDRFNLFSEYNIFGENKKIKIKVSEKFEYLLNKILGNYTKFDLIDFVRLKSIYSKNIFKLLKQWESVKEYKISIIDFKEYLGVSDKYTTANFNTRVLGPIMQDLPQHFDGLKLEKIKTGKKITHLKFVWTQKKEKIVDKEKIEIEITESLNQIFEKVKKNRYLKNWITDKNIYKLTEMYEDKPLKKGLNYIYKNEKKEIPNFVYFLKILESGIEEQEYIVKVVSESFENKKIVQTLETLENSEDFKNKILEIFSKMKPDIQNVILNQAKEMYMKDVNIENMNAIHEKFFDAAKKNYILKIFETKNL
ncbi:MAG: replication initiation protein [Cetobacterium sp.]